MIKANEFVEAGKALKVAQQLEPGRWDCSTYQGFLAYKTGDLEGAAASLRKALELNPRHGPSHLMLGVVLGKQQSWRRRGTNIAWPCSTNDAVLGGEEGALRAIAEINERLPGK